MIKRNRFIFGIVLAVLLLLGIFFIFKNIVSVTGNVVSEEYNLEKFVNCLNNQNIFVYSLQNDSAVEMQLSLFENYSQNLTILDCTAHSEKCIGIVVFPTWNINEVLVHGSLSLNILSRFSGCSLY